MAFNVVLEVLTGTGLGSVSHGEVVEFADVEVLFLLHRTVVQRYYEEVKLELLGWLALLQH